MRQRIKIAPITLDWSRCVAWGDLRAHARREGGVSVANTSGVYEVRSRDQEERLDIGRAANLRHRIRQALVKGKSPHSTGRRIRATEDTSRLVVRWAVTDRPAAAEEELHRRHLRRFGRLPKYTRHT